MFGMSNECCTYSTVVGILIAMPTWKEFDANELTHSAAHHLLAIHEVGLPYGGWARVSDIARELAITRGSVSINLRALKKRGWIETGDHRLVRLSASGLKVVQAVMAKRKVLRAFLRDVLGTSDSQADIDSCKIEHLISDATGQALVRFMRFLASGDSVAKNVLARFRRSHNECPESRTCDVCEGHCLFDELQRAI